MKRTILSIALFLMALSIGTAQTVYLDEDFEGGLPNSWSQTTLATDGGWLAGTGPGLSSSAFGIPAHTNILATNDDGCNCDKSVDSLMTESVDLSGASGLVVLQYDRMFAGATYQGATESMVVAVYSMNNSMWTVEQTLPTTNLFAWEDAVTVDLSAYIGDEIKVAFVYNDGGGWLYGAAIDNVIIYEAADYDVNNLSVDNGAYLEVNTSADITGTVVNLGSQTITSLEMSYSVDGGAPVTATISGLNIAPLASYSYTHPTAWTPTTEQLSTIETAVVSINGNLDANLANNLASTQVLVHPTAVARKPLLEAFTSSTCAPCAPGNANVASVMSAFEGQYCKVNYQMSWPGAGDPYFTDEGDDRRNFYAVNSVPNIFTDGENGMNSNSYTSQTFTSALQVPAFVNITVEGDVYKYVKYMVDGSGNLVVDSSYYVVNVSTDIQPIIEMPSGLVAHISVNEDLTFNNVESNGETEFEFVMKKMLPDALGSVLPAISAQSTETVAHSHKFVGDYRLPNDAGDPINHAIEHSVEEFDDLTAVVWVQNPTTGEVWQSEQAPIVMLDSVTNVEEEIVDGQTVYTIDGMQYVANGDGTLAPMGVNGLSDATIKLYPNPAKDNLNISGLNGLTNIQVIDAAGRVVMNEAISNGNLNISSLESGVYTISLELNGEQVMKRITVAR